MNKDNNTSGITSGEWKASQDTFYSVKDDHRIKIYVEGAKYYFIAFGPDKETVLRNAKELSKSLNLSQKYGSLEELEKRMKVAEANVSDREYHANFLSDKRTMLQETCDEQLIEISDLERQVKELREIANNLLFICKTPSNKLDSVTHGIIQRAESTLQTTKAI